MSYCSQKKLDLLKNESVKSPEFIGNVSNQNIHGLPVYDYIMVTHPKFIEPTKTLADFHRQKNNLRHRPVFGFCSIPGF